MVFDNHFRPPDLTGWLAVPGFGSPDAPLTRPVPPSNQPGPNPFLRTTLPANFGLASVDTLRQFYNPAVPQNRLVPLARAADPAYAAIAKTVMSAASAAPAELSSSDPFLKFRGVWQSFTPYAVNDVVLFNQSAYIAVAASAGVEPDSGFASVRQGGNSQNWAGGGRSASFTFASSLLAGSKILVSVESGNLANQGGSLLTPTDTQGNTYTLVAQASVTDSGGGVYTCATYIATAQAGACTVSAQWSTIFGFGGLACSATEILGLASSSADSITSASVVAPIGGSIPVPSMTLSASQASDLMYSACNFNGVAGVPDQTNPPGFAPSGFSPYLLASGGSVSGAAIALSALVGTNAIQWGGGPVTGNLTNGERFVATAVSFKTIPSTWALLSEAFVFNVPASAQTYSPFDVIQFRGSTFVCLKPTSSDAFSDPSSWGLFAQGTGSVVSLSGNYTPVSGDYGRLIQNDTASSYTVTLPTPPNNSWWIALQNSGTGTIVLSPGSLTLDGSSASITLHQGQGLLVFTDGTNYFTWRGFGTVTNITGALTNNAVVLGNGGSDVKALGSLGTTTTVLHGNTGAPSYASVTENDFSLSDVTTNNVSTTQHGFVPKAPGDATKFLDGTGNYSAPSGIVLSDTSVSGTLISQSVSGTLRPNGVVPPAGVYRVKVYTLMQANPSPGTLAVNIGWNDGTAARNAAPANISTAALNAAGGGSIITADGVHDVTYALTLT